MAAPGVSGRPLGKWEDIIAKYPIEQVQKIEQQLRGELNVNRERLRSLVGASYRDLLQTADRIIDMDASMTKIEAQLQQVAVKSDSRTLNRIARNVAQFDAHTKAGYCEEQRKEALLRTLGNCPLVVSTLLRKGGQLLTAAKILVISRLLHKALSLEPDLETQLESIRKKLASLHRRLLQRVDRLFSELATSPRRTIDAMCAFILATKATPLDCIRHFQHIRLSAIEQSFEEQRLEDDGIEAAMKVLAGTIAATKATARSFLPEALAKLKSRPLLQDPEVLSQIVLHLDEANEWIPAEIKNFTPWIQQDDLQRNTLLPILKQWVVKACGALRHGLNPQLLRVEHLPDAVRLRTKTLRAWLSSAGEFSDLVPPDTFQDFRGQFSDRMVAILKQQARGVRDIGQQTERVLQEWKPGRIKEASDLWDTSLVFMDLDDGAATFQKSIINRVRGHDETILEIIGDHRKTVASLQGLSKAIEQMRKERWDEIVEDEDDDNSEVVARQLTTEDPDLLMTEFDKAVATALKDLSNTFDYLVKVFSSENRAAQAVFLIRVIREIRHRQLEYLVTIDFGASVLPTLQATVVDTVVDTPTELLRAQITKQWRSDSAKAASVLWEGEASLPSLPSPAAFKFLRKLITEMTALGTDLWTPETVARLKTEVREKVAQCYSSLAMKKEGEEGGDDMARYKMVQTAFDMLYLEQALRMRENTSDSLVIEKDTADSLAKSYSSFSAKVELNAKDEAQLRGNAGEYWKKTHLLFGLLA